MKLEQFCLIFEQLIYLVNSWRVVKKHINHQEDDDGESGGFIVVVMGECIKCELAGVRNVFLLLLWGFKGERQKAWAGASLQRQWKNPQGFIGINFFFKKFLLCINGNSCRKSVY